MARVRSGSAARWTRLERDERRNQILAVARRLFSERHYSAVSTAEIAREAGVTRGLLHHYYGAKRDLYLEVVRSLFELPPDLLVAPGDGKDPEGALGAAVDRWLDAVEGNRETWLATAAALGFGRDPELEAIVDQAREAYAERVVSILRPGRRRAASPELRAVVRAYAGLVEAATLDWIEGRGLNRAQLRELLVQGLVRLERDVVPGLERHR
jgi:AcrR family transcriptional regulator